MEPRLKVLFFCAVCDFLWPPCVADADIIFLSCGFFYIFDFLYSWPNLSGRRLDVCHTSTHGVALVRIYNAGLKCAAHGSLEMQDPKIAKNSPSRHHRTILSGYIFGTKAYIDNGKILLNSNISPPHMSSQYGELRPTNG